MTETLETRPRAAELRGVALLDLVISQIELSPQTWEQETWRCETGMCVAGWTAALAGGRWLTDADDGRAAYLIAEPDDETPRLIPLDRWEHDEEGAVISARDRAKRLLGLSEDGADDLFGANNSLEYIKTCREHLARGQEMPRVAGVEITVESNGRTAYFYRAAQSSNA